MIIMKNLHNLILAGLVGMGSVGTVLAQDISQEISQDMDIERYGERIMPGRSACDYTRVLVIGKHDDEVVKFRAYDMFARSLRVGPQQVGMPRFMITDRAGKAAFAIGGFVNFRTAYDFNNEVQNIDFVTYDIPMVSTPSNKQRLLMDASTTRLYFKSVINAGKAGPIEAYVETDFRGGVNGYNLRLREAYVSVKGFLFGQTATTFCDLAATPNTIDFEGPNGYTYGRNLMIRYAHRFNKHWSLALAAEFPQLNATTGTRAEVIPQRIPDIPAYVQYSWSKERSHIRLSGVLRSMNYYDKVNRSTELAFGYGVQLSTVIRLGRVVSLTGQALYGKGLTPYIQDLQASKLDLLPVVDNPGELKAVPAMAWLAGAQFNFTPKLAMTVGYSQVHVWHSGTDFAASDYKLGQYAVANLIYSITPYLQVGAEYLYGTRIDQNNKFGKANRVQAMVQFNF